MSPRYVVDTNVLIAASAADPEHPSDIDATPADSDLRKQIWRWLQAFRDCESRLVLDSSGKILDEYSRKLRGDSFGRLMVLHKWSTLAVDDVNILLDADGHGILPETLAIVHDKADRKMVAAALAAQQNLGACPIAFGGDTDWHEWESELTAHGVKLEPIIEAWSRAKYLEKQAR